MTVDNAKKEQKKEIFPIEDEKSSKYRTYSILSYFIVLVIIGLPVWWYTTRVYRADLPLTEMSNLELESKLSKQLGIPLSLEYDVLITVVNPEPQNLEIELDAKQIGEALEPFLHNISSVAKFTVKSQWLHLIDIGVVPKKVENGYMISEEQLPHIITPLEKNLWSHISSRPCLNLVLYVPPCSSSPLNIYKKKVGKEFTKSTSNAMLTPSWGGIYIVNPTMEDCKNKKFQPEIDSIVSTFTTHLKMMFNLKNSRNPEDLRKLYKRKASNMIDSSKRTLKSLAQLLSEINSIVISDEVAEKIKISLESVENAELYLKADEINLALKFAKVAFNNSEKAFGDPSLLALLYFPDDQKQPWPVKKYDLKVIFVIFLKSPNVQLGGKLHGRNGSIMIPPSNKNIQGNSAISCTNSAMSRPSTSSVKNRKGGIIFIWPQRRNFQKYKELILSTWFLTHLYYWMHLLQLLPTDHVLNIPHPPWSYEPPPLKPRERDFIIEPDWDS